MSAANPVLYVVLPSVIAKDKKVKIVLGLADKPSEELWFDKAKGTSGLHVGHIYAIPTTVEGERRVLSFGHKKWQGEYKGDHAMLLTWQSAQKALEMTLAAKAREKRESSDTSALEDALRPIARAYSQIPYPHRVAFEVWVLSVIRRA